MAAPAAAHTEPDLVAVPAGSPATVTLRPTHGCGESPTVRVSIRAPMSGATAGEVLGWTATATPDTEGRTVLEWTGGSLPSHETGLFPVNFTVPDKPGELLTFPSVQQCENGDTLSWIDGNPGAEFPAPRVLILPAGSAPAATIDDVPADAPGRDQLVGIVDVDNPNSTTSQPTTTTTTTTSPAPSTTSVATSEPADDGTNVMPMVAGAVLLAIAVAAVVLARRRRA